MSISDFVYYTVLKHGKILIIILGFVLFVLIYLNAKRFGLIYSDTTEASLKNCFEDHECFFYCGSCYSIKPTQFCFEEIEEEVECVCIDNKCQIS